jgi:hypothetical protein
MTAILPQLGTILSALPSTNDIATQLIQSAGVSVVMAGLSSTAGQNAIDPLHLIFKTTTTTPGASPAPAANIPTITGAAFAALPAAAQTTFLASGGHIV